MNKGIVFSLDAMIALLLAVIITTFIYVSIEQSSSNYDELFLHKSAVDVLTVLREDRSLEVFNNASVYSFLDSLPVQFCANLTVYDFNDRIVYNALKSKCTTEGKIVGTSRRVFIVNSTSVYLGEVKMWYG
ncbi:hypothetical protein HY500_01330 [Candidatus Woesearchaeota archaeon]|nr:hypothetical protein [Candidatus Woesearchaeota archaeon]